MARKEQKQIMPRISHELSDQIAIQRKSIPGKPSFNSYAEKLLENSLTVPIDKAKDINGELTVGVRTMLRILGPKIMDSLIHDGFTYDEALSMLTISVTTGEIIPEVSTTLAAIVAMYDAA